MRYQKIRRRDGAPEHLEGLMWQVILARRERSWSCGAEHEPWANRAQEEGSCDLLSQNIQFLIDIALSVHQVC